jgi:hypothetical protein
VTAAPAEVAYLLTPRAVREQGHAMLALAEEGALESFAIDWTRLAAITDRVLAVTRASYPEVAAIPPHSRWRHFGAGGVDRQAPLEGRLAALDRLEAVRARFDLVVTSVLLDAGAGPSWRFREAETGLALGRSEGLAIASLHMFLSGAFSGAAAIAPLRADAAGLRALTEASLARHFQVGPDNPLVGLSGRVALLRRLGEVVATSPRFFAGASPRVGDLADFLLARVTAGALPAATILAAVLEALGPIWPGRHSVGGSSLGDTWPHPRLGLVPFHKLSQWLTYSLIEPLEAHGVRVTDLDALTGLAEYRNGGLFLDGGLLVPRSAVLLGESHAVGSPVVVEWRALTVALLDVVARELRARLGCDAVTLPLAKVLEGGTWAAGRAIAAELRPDGGPPLRVQSDGTVF